MCVKSPTSTPMHLLVGLTDFTKGRNIVMLKDRGLIGRCTIHTQLYTINIRKLMQLTQCHNFYHINMYALVIIAIGFWCSS